MKITRLLQAAIFLLFLQINIAHGQTNKGELIKSKTIRSEISPTETHRYSVTLESNQFAFFKLSQMGVDMKISTFDSEGKKLEDFDSPNGKYGPELFSLKTEKAGLYTIEVSAFDEKEPSGIYEIVLQSVKSKAISDSEKVDEIFTAWDSNTSPGASVAIVKDGAIIYKNGYGMANLEYDIPNSPSTIFHIASVSKQFTVFSILLLEEEGKLSLDDDIRKYIPEVPDFGETITLRHLASHTSGMRDQWNLLSMAGWRFDDVITKEHVMKLVEKQKELNFKPGEKYTYCNTGFTLLAEVVARISEQTFAEFTHNHIFEPLGMKSSLFYDDHEKIVRNRAYSYYADKNGYKKSVLSYANVGATSLFTTVEDLSLWAVNFSDLKVGSQSIVKKMNTLAVLNNGKTFGGALGQFVGQYKGVNEIQHGGADAGYRSYLTRFPDENISVIVFSNAAEFNPGGIAHKVADIYLKDKIEIEEKSVELEKKEVDKVVVSQEILNSYVGEYELQPGFIIKITETDGQLSAEATGQGVVTLSPISTTEFQVEQVEAKVEFVPESDGSVKLMKLHQGGQIMDAPRTMDFDKGAVNLSEFEGTYFSEELSTSYEFVVEEGELKVRHSRLSDFTLTPTKQDFFSADAWFFGLVEFVRDADLQITGCKVTNGRVRNLKFQKVE